MNTVFIIVGVIAVIFFGLIIYTYYKGKNTPEVTTSKNIMQLNYKNMKHQIRKGIVVVDFWAGWCTPCKIMLPALNDIADDEKNDIRIAKVNIDQQRVLAKKYKIRSIPTLIIFNNGFEAGRIVGVKSKKAILKEIQEAVS